MFISVLSFVDSQARAAAQWFELKHDVSHKSTNTIGYPGSVLLKLSLANMQDIVDVCTLLYVCMYVCMYKTYCIFVYIFVYIFVCMYVCMYVCMQGERLGA